MSYKKSSSLSESTIIKELKPLDHEKIYRAKEMLVETHPLSQIGLDEALPILKPVFRLCMRKKKKANQDTKESLLADDQEGNTQPISKPNSLKKKRSYVEKLKEKLRLNGFSRRNQQNFADPFIQYGYGVVAFFNLLRVLILLFFALSLLSLPMIIVYSQQTNTISSYYKLAATTLGNLGSAYSQCYQTPLDINSLQISCEDKTIAEISSAGIVPFHQDDNLRTCHYHHPEIQDSCYLMYENRFKDALRGHCLGRNNCTIENIRKYFTSDSYLQSQLGDCMDPKALVFVQVKCYLSEERLQTNQFIGLLSVCSGIFICFIYLFVVYFQYQANELDFVLWDLQTVTANDYSIDMAINDKILREYEKYSQIHPIQENENKSEHLSNFIKSYIEDHLIKYGRQVESQQLIDEDKLKVLMIQFDFSQGPLVNLMIQRGEQIKNLKFGKRRQIEAKINKELIRNKAKYDNPCRCFVTFEYTDGHNLFIQMAKDNQPREYIDYQGIDADSAPIPSNIIWQQRNKSKQEFLSKRFVSFIAIFGLLILTMVGVFFIRQYGTRGVAAFKRQNCKWAYNQYQDKLRTYAVLAYQESKDYFDDVMNHNVDQEDLNLVTCHCIKTHNSIFYYGFRKKYDIIQNQTYVQEPIEKEMCEKFETNYLFANSINFVSSETIVILNFILRLIIIFIVKYIGYDTESLQTSRIMVYVFIVQFINTDLIILFMNADLSQTGWIIFQGINQGLYPDFTVLWYKDIGLMLINTMLFNIYWPILEFFVFYGLRLFFRILDRGFTTCSPWKTKSVTIQQYLDIYSGPEYTIHYKYSAILNITFITMMFGAGMPILFPIAFASFMTLYVMERLMIAYSYKQPPMLDETLNRLVIKILLYAPLLYCTVGYWMFNNVQIFSNSVGVKQYLNDSIQTGHDILSAFRISHSSPLLFVTSLFLFIAITRRWSMKYVQRMLNLDPQIYIFKPGQVSFIQALNQDQRKWLIKEEKSAREKFGIKKLSDETLDKLENQKQSEETELIGVLTYQILDNPIYQKLFQYVPEIIDNRDNYIFDDWIYNSLGQSDYVKKNLNTFYLPKVQNDNN